MSKNERTLTVYPMSGMCGLTQPSADSISRRVGLQENYAYERYYVLNALFVDTAGSTTGNVLPGNVFQLRLRKRVVVRVITMSTGLRTLSLVCSGVEQAGSTRR